MTPRLAAGAAHVLAALALLLGCACGSVHRGDGDGSGEPGDGGGEDGGSDDGGGDDAADDGADGGAELCEGASGSRLRRVLRQHEDGTVEAIAMHDTELDTRCQFGLDGQGNVRCLPDLFGRFVIASIVYSDAACTSAVADIPFPFSVPPAYAAVSEPGASCSPRRRWYQLGAQLPLDGSSVIYFRSEQGVCEETLASSSRFYFAVAAELPLDSFVAGNETRPDGGRLGVRVVDGEDGSRFCDRRGAFRDAALDGHACSPNRGEDGVLRCLPEVASTMQVSTDIGCAGEFTVASVSTSCDLGHAYTRQTVAPGCVARWRINALGEQVPGALYSYLPFDGCYPAPADRQYYEIGATVAPTSFAELADERVAVGGRLHRVDLVGDGVRVDRPWWYDSTLDIGCRFTVAADGAWRCLPGTTDEPEASITGFYTDPACKSAGIELASFSDPCESGREPRFVVAERSGGMRVFELGRAVEGPVYQWSGGGCGSLPLTTRVHTVGEEVPLASFVSGTEMVEP